MICIVFVICGSRSILPLSSELYPTMLAYDTGFFKMKEIFRIGIVLDLIGIVVVLVMTWTLFGLFVIWVT